MDEEWQDTNAEVERVLENFPEAREFLPLITATTVTEFEDVARAIAEKVRNIKSKGNQQTPSPRAPKPEKEKAMTVEEAISTKSWPDYLHAKWEAAGRD